MFPPANGSRAHRFDATTPRSEARLPLLITGVAGVTGHNALPYFRARYPGRVVGVRPVSNWRLTGPDIVAVDLEDAKAVRELFARHGFRSVLHCGGNCALKACELDPSMAHRVNVEGVANLLANIAGRSIRLVHLSSDLVFSGRGSGGYAEEAPTDPVSVYGKTMALAERMVFDRVPDALVLRISLPMGPSFNGHAGAIDWIASRFRKSKPATLYFDEVRTPTYSDDMNRCFERLLTSDLRGLFHCGGPRRLSLFQIAQIVNRVGRFDPKLLCGCPRRDAGPVPPRAGNVSLDSGKLLGSLDAFSFRSWPAMDHLVPNGRRWHFERSESVEAPDETGIGGLLYRCD